MNFCPNCGRECKETAKFCGGCGFVLAQYKEPDAGKSHSFDDIGVKEPRYSDYMKKESSDTASGSSSNAEDTESSYRSTNTEYAYSTEVAYSGSGSNGFAIASLILGILAIPFNVFFFLPGVLAIVFGIVGLNRAKQTGSMRGIAMAGLILGIITTAGWLILIICGITFAAIMSVL